MKVNLKKRKKGNYTRNIIYSIAAQAPVMSQEIREMLIRVK